MATNEKIEMRWVAAWNDASDLVRGEGNVPCLLPDRSIVTFDECLGWLQDSVYSGFAVHVEKGWVGHRRGIVASRKPMED